MADLLPFGVLVRMRRDWALEGLMIGTVIQPNDNPLQARFSLNNTSATGDYLAVYGILATRYVQPYLMAADIIAGTVGAAISSSRTLVPGRGVIGGVLGLENVSAAIGATLPQPLVFQANGQWLTLGEIPIFVVPVGSRLVVFPYAFNDNNVSNESMSCSFLWSYYQQPTLASTLVDALRRRLGR